MMRTIISAVLLTGLLVSGASAQSFFDKLQQKSKEALEAIEDAGTTETQGKKQRVPFTKAGKKPVAGQAGESARPFESAADLYGYWKGRVDPPGHGSSMGTIGVDVLITPEAGSMRVSFAADRCLAELKPTGTLGMYEASFLDESSRCGTRAALTFTDGMNLSIDWTDMEGLEPEKRTYKGRLNIFHAPHDKSWSVPAKARESFDVVGFKLGMSFEDALAHIEAKHPDLGSEGAIATDLGTTSIVKKFTEKGAKKLGSDVFGEQITLYFESQTPEEMQVEQSPEVMARIKEREAVEAKRAEMTEEHNKSLSSLRRGQNAPPLKLPDVPDMPRLRPDGAEAELIIASRRLMFASNRGPHQDNVIDALSEKYGKPSIYLKDLGSTGGRHHLFWLFDADNNRIEDAAGGVCDHSPKHLYNNKELASTFSPGNTRWVFNTVTISEKCGLTVRVRINVNGNGSVYQINTSIYDQQRLLGDEWYRAVKLSEALIAERKAATKILKKRDVPDF